MQNFDKKTLDLLLKAGEVGCFKGNFTSSILIINQNKKEMYEIALENLIKSYLLGYMNSVINFEFALSKIKIKDDDPQIQKMYL